MMVQPSFSLIHLADLQCGFGADDRALQKLRWLVPELEPDLVVLTGDVTRHCRTGEFAKVRQLVSELEEAAEVMAVPGDRDLQWWRRPYLPVGSAAKYERFQEFVRSEIAPTVDLPDAVVVGVTTAHGLAWGSLTAGGPLSTAGYLPRRETRRAKQVFSQAAETKARIVVMHHSPLSGANRLARVKSARKRLLDAGADIVLCGDGSDWAVEMIHGVTIVCGGSRGKPNGEAKSVGFHRMSVDHRSVNIELYRWSSERNQYYRSDLHAFARRRVVE
ncbi:MAG: metallophosphoesterase family protein [Gemmatimonadales bacterium]